ncbi:DUF2075 domain-containing protein [Fructobacillus evanidus]|uniref:DUF2075 family (BH3996) n=1 Tax=Fructobacillus evanidus TaxID=3064281 RepID=A0ABM9MXT3_9LACO|nr:DUF2075 family (BH3996) [Fructobacillus sp. LMG 32999]CAK1247003.1 DUF2075 family (BH3996) [Fructobacillus sp. LMG 32999]CAK1247833.1 DUF2075 family (BH3996) [Fructobacillus sp. LMG 32999]CAK1249344.1 DUF2075 family (BH3996) [Fructobacillus sp. LMG 32999]CAK1253671.1 DUF2075 family (BH3996) [Fructobacillus sp. LMG 32999]
MENDNLKPFDIDQMSANQQDVLADLQKYINESLKTSDHHVAVIEGAAGTGKSVLLTRLFKNIRQGLKDPASPYQGLKTVFTVNHPELLKVYQEMGARYSDLYKKDYVRPTSLINSAHKTDSHYDVVLIDEGHLLLSKREPYIRFFQDNQLSEIIKLAKVVVVVFDFQQVIQGKMFWNQKLLNQVLAPYDHRVFPMDFQYRMEANASVSAWIDDFVTGKLTPLPVNQGDYDLRIFERADDLFETIKERNEEGGLARVLATTGFQRRADGAHHVVLDGFDLPWDEFDAQVKTWPNRPESINQVGSIYTVQGFDLNYAGVLLSPAFEYDAKNDRMVVNSAKVTHKEIYKKNPNLTDAGAIAQAKTDFMYNALNILAKRGKKGLYLKAADPALNARLLALQNQAK